MSQSFRIHLLQPSLLSQSSHMTSLCWWTKWCHHVNLSCPSRQRQMGTGDQVTCGVQNHSCSEWVGEEPQTPDFAIYIHNISMLKNFGRLSETLFLWNICFQQQQYLKYLTVVLGLQIYFVADSVCELGTAALKLPTLVKSQYLAICLSSWG